MFTDVKLSKDAVKLLLITQFWLIWMSFQTHFSIIQYRLKTDFVELYSK